MYYKWRLGAATVCLSPAPRSEVDRLACYWLESVAQAGWHLKSGYHLAWGTDSGQSQTGAPLSPWLPCLLRLAHGFNQLAAGLVNCWFAQRTTKGLPITPSYGMPKFVIYQHGAVVVGKPGRLRGPDPMFPKAYPLLHQPLLHQQLQMTV
jgi:hypothetical protein